MPDGPVRPDFSHFAMASRLARLIKERRDGVEALTQLRETSHARSSAATESAGSQWEWVAARRFRCVWEPPGNGATGSG